MEKSIFKYSQFFFDDGAFEQAFKKIDAFGDKIVESAKKTQAEYKKALNFDNSDAVAEYEKNADELSKMFKKQQKAKKDLLEIEKKYNEVMSDTTGSAKNQISILTKLDKELQAHREYLSAINKAQKTGVDIGKDLNEERVKAQLAIKKVSKKIQEQQKAIAKQNELSREEQKLANARLILQNKEVETRKEIKERIAALNVVIDAENKNTEEGRQQIELYIAEQEKLREEQKKLSDTYTQSKINVGNYEESIVSAMESTGLFTTNISGLDGVLNNVIGLLTLSKEELEEMNDKLENGGNAIQKFAVRFGKMNKVLKASIIGAILIAVAALGSVFGDTRQGAANMEKVMLGLKNTMTGLGLAAQEIVKSVIGLFDGFGDNLKIMMLQAKIFFADAVAFSSSAKREVATMKGELEKLKLQQEENNKETENTASLWERLKGVFNNTKDAIVKGMDNINKAFIAEDRVKQLTIELIHLRQEYEELTAVSEDSTKSLNQQIQASENARKVLQEVGQKEIEIAQKQLEIANERVKAQALQQGLIGKELSMGAEGVTFAQQTLNYLQGKGTQVKLNNELIEQQQQAYQNLLDVQNEIATQEQENYKTRREVIRDLFEQNLDYLIDEFDNRKKLSEQFINDATKNYQDRLLELDKLVKGFRKNAQDELDEFNTLAGKTSKVVLEEITSLENKRIKNQGRLSKTETNRLKRLQNELKQLNAIDLSIEWQDDGTFKVMNGDVQLNVESLKEMNKRLQELGLSEVAVNQMKNFFTETTAAVKDFIDLSDAMTDVGIKFRELSSNLVVSDEELEKIDRLQTKIQDLKVQASQRGLSIQQRRQIIRDIKALEDEKTFIEQKGSEERTQNKINAINEEIKLIRKEEEKRLKSLGLSDVEVQAKRDENVRIKELLQQRNDIEKKLRDERIKKELKDEEERQKKIIEYQKKLAAEMRAVISKVLDAAVDAQNKQVQKSLEATEKQKEMVSKQEERAKLGLKNTLAFEERELAKREAERIKEEKRKQRLEKVKALYSSYSNYASQGDGDNAITKTLRDFAILESITASFGDGGIVEDVLEKAPTNGKGIIRGRSHQGRNGGIPILVEGQEGIFSKREMANLGKENFYKMKEIASMGKVEDNIFKRQNNDFKAPILLQNSNGSQEVVNGIKSLENAINNKPTSRVDVDGISEMFYSLIETIESKGKVKRNIHKIKKPRI